ncbi:erythromycin esterase family protein [Actinomycetospora termitidis]|uniref:Erythromycin esterase family protein n=1 Tax=Actinomycetospora termitidis TaxID=3053470 RepID=A0ABT7M591_9PSEU|nr:erythromycin esterase family protein [Actinomycetospora sp. Odt1-22]MDL5155718.1 erythromycin esterase family protein [Actinomycetospora sp. Odt1-22]
MDDGVADELAARAVPVDAVGLDAWRPALRDVQVLGVGAAAHGARELLELGRRVLEWAVDELGVRVVVIGASEGGATGLDAAARGVGVPGEAVASLGGWEYDTREVVDLVSWLRDRNEMVDPDDRVRVVGADPVRPARSVKVLGAYLRAVAPDLLPAARDALAELLDREPDERPLKAHERDAVVGLHQEMVGARARLVAESSPDRYAEALDHAWILARAAEVAAAPRGRPFPTAEEAEQLSDTSAPVLRARLAAEAVARAADGATGRPAAVFWGHDDLVRVGDPTTAGRHLRSRLGAGYYAVGGLFVEGSASAVRRRLLRPIRVRPSTHKLPALAGTAEAQVQDAVGATDSRLVDLRGASGELADWAATPTTTRRIGSVVDSGQLRERIPVVPAREYDALALVPRVHPAWIR